MTDYWTYGLAWAAFGGLHSLLARRSVKLWAQPFLGRSYRLTYNGVAILAVLAVGWVGGATLGHRPAFALPTGLSSVLVGLHLAGWAVMIWAGRYTDLGRLGGLTQWRFPDAPDDGPLVIRGPYRWTRHPLYLGGHLILWGLAVSPLGLATALWGSLYLLIGAKFEERDLLRRYGPDYARYCRDVPFLLPWKGCAIKAPPPSER